MCHPIMTSCFALTDVIFRNVTRGTYSDPCTRSRAPSVNKSTLFLALIGDIFEALRCQPRLLLLVLSCAIAVNILHPFPLG